MRNLLRFIKVYHFSLLFILIESFSIFLLIYNNDLQKSRFLIFTQKYTGTIYKSYDNLNRYFNLKEENRKLKKQIAREKNKNQILNNRDNISNAHTHIPARIIKNSVFKKNNYIMINKGKKHGVVENMGVISNNAVIGTIQSSSENFSIALSVLNTITYLPIQHERTKEIGVLLWEGKNHMEGRIKGLQSKNIKIGDIISTSGNGLIFQEGIKVGRIVSINNKNGGDKITIRFFNNLNLIKNVYITKSKGKNEQNKLENKIKETILKTSKIKNEENL